MNNNNDNDNGTNRVTIGLSESCVCVRVILSNSYCQLISHFTPKLTAFNSVATWNMISGSVALWADRRPTETQGKNRYKRKD